MSEHYPKIRVLARDGSVWVKEGLSACFFMRQPHSELAPGVMRSLETFRRAIGPHALTWYGDSSGDWAPLDEEGWKHIRHELLEEQWASIRLISDSRSEMQYQFDYLGNAFGHPTIRYGRDEACVLTYWLPTSLLEEHGPQRLRELMLELAAPLPFSSGNAGLSFNCQLDEAGVERQVHKYCFRYPGLDVLRPGSTALEIGTRVRGPSWLTFLGQPVLGELGGAAGLRSRLHTPGTTVQELDADRAVVTLGPWPEAGDTEQGKDLPAWRELARVLEPWTLQGEGTRILGLDPEDARRWERRFLD